MWRPSIMGFISSSCSHFIKNIYFLSKNKELFLGGFSNVRLCHLPDLTERERNQRATKCLLEIKRILNDSEVIIFLRIIYLSESFKLRRRSFSVCVSNTVIWLIRPINVISSVFNYLSKETIFYYLCCALVISVSVWS